MSDLYYLPHNIFDLGSPASLALLSAVVLTAEKDLPRGLICPGFRTIVRYSVPDSDSPEPLCSWPWTPSSPPDTPHSISSFLSAMDNDRMVSVEQAIVGIQEQQAELNQRFEQLLKAITPCPDLPAPKTDAPLSPVLSKSCTACPLALAEFDGECSKGMAFLSSCQTYIQLCPREFADEQTKIIWAMSYMKSSHAQKWTARIFH